jgi:CRISPR-associated endoribonuclease Cas6
MRIQINIKSQNNPVPLNYQPAITGAIHKWIGKNEVHDKTSMYSFSWLKGGNRKGRNLIFENETSFQFSSYDNEIVKSIITGIQNDPTINYGLEVCEIVIQETPLFSKNEIFFVSSPVLVKRSYDEREIHFTYDNVESDGLLTETMKTKLTRAGLNADNVQVGFDRNYSGAKTKLVYYKKIGNKANICPIIIHGTPEQIEFAWNVGVGNSTGIGFGSLK